MEPIGEERDDLRIGALASVIYNMNLDTRKLGGPIKAHRYITGWADDRVHMMMLVPDQTQIEGNLSGHQSGSDHTLNNPSVWQNFKAGLKKVYGTGRKSNPGAN